MPSRKKAKGKARKAAKEAKAKEEGSRAVASQRQEESVEAQMQQLMVSAASELCTHGLGSGIVYHRLEWNAVEKEGQRQSAEGGQRSKAAKKESRAVVSVTGQQRQVEDESVEALLHRLVINDVTPQSCRHGLVPLSADEE